MDLNRQPSELKPDVLTPTPEPSPNHQGFPWLDGILVLKLAWAWAKASLSTSWTAGAIGTSLWTFCWEINI